MRQFLYSLTILTILFIISACANEPEGDLTNNEINVGENETNEQSQSEENNMNNHEDSENDDHMTEHGHSDDQHNEFANEPENMNPEADNQLMHAQTKNVTRLDVSSEVDMSIYVSQLIWPATHEENQPGTVILAPLEDWQKSLVSTTLIHHPNNGPVLFMEELQASDDVLAEIERLNPTGNDDGVELMVIGEASDETLSQLRHYNLEELNGENPARYAADIDH